VVLLSKQIIIKPEIITLIYEEMDGVNYEFK